MWIVCITSVRHVLTVNGYGGRQTKENEKSWCFKGWETLVPLYKKEIEQKNDFPSHSLYQHSRPTAISAGRNSHPIISHLPIRKLSIPSCLF